MKYILMVAMILLSGCGEGINYSEGSRMGKIKKLSKKGLICKTWEGEAYLNPESAAPETFDFSVTDESVIPDLQKAMNLGQMVELEYTQRVFTGFCSPSTPYRIKGVK